MAWTNYSLEGFYWQNSDLYCKFFPVIQQRVFMSVCHVLEIILNLKVWNFSKVKLKLTCSWHMPVVQFLGYWIYSASGRKFCSFPFCSKTSLLSMPAWWTDALHLWVVSVKYCLIGQWSYFVTWCNQQIFFPLMLLDAGFTVLISTLCKGIVFQLQEQDVSVVVLLL